ncbi:hypothetical protein KHA93_15645 [Bacillus sp. FJAT-49732]|uniref:Uncharacterized protein n=1 Tax=Lederbergia citrisecunda TaxID=2833583 RepID=A0A942TQJ7_9BACI|nr:hypothetical protein [Lederbergia citrisecunda]MBS4201072.1 hypothetical protein [Lederbergia citrisecunda]
MNNIYVEEKLIKYKERERQRIADQAWMFTAKKKEFPFKETLFLLIKIVTLNK